MGFFATFSTWLDGMLVTYIGTNTAKIATLITPAIATLATVYVMVWGYLQLTGKIEEPFATGIKRIILLVVILGGALNLWLYNDLIVDTFFRSPGVLAAGVIGAYDSVAIIDQIIFAGGDAASLLIQKGGIYNGVFSYYLAVISVYFLLFVPPISAMLIFAISTYP